MKKLLVLILSLILLTGCTTAKDKYYAIDHFYIKEEGDAFLKAYDDLVVATYSWYQSIENSEGVYIMHHERYSRNLLMEWKAAGYMKNVPDSDVNYYVASVNYLEDRGIALSEADKKMIAEGVRFYLLPDTLGEEETEKMKMFLEEDALHGLDGETLIDTAFRRDRKIEFRTYHFDGTLEIPGEDEIKDPVIYAASSSSMKYFEAESLIATGVKDGYIRLTEAAYQKYAKDALPQNLKDRKVTFLGLSRIDN